MSKGPKGEKRPRATNQLAKLMVDILTGEVQDRAPAPEEQGKDPGPYKKASAEISGGPTTPWR
jgi:hypothetical protein